MPLPAGDAIRRRDQVLARTRRASRWITAVAIAASVGIGGAVAHALPGRHPAAQAATAPDPASSSGGQRAGQGPDRRRHHSAASHHHKRHHHHLRPPAQPPSPSPSPPAVVSGGS
jgi:hypothetical protein